MSLPADQRHLLGAFLRARREAWHQPDTSRRRRTPGLRREEVAQLSGISTTWYTWVEQGRDITLSAAALARLAAALRLTPAERAYLFELTRRRDPHPPIADPAPEAVPAELRALLQATQSPAHLLDRFWSACAWNAAADRLFAPWFDSNEACLLRYVFLDPSARDFICDWDDRARNLLAEFRADTAQDAEDPALQTLIQALADDSPAFARFWDDHAVLAREGGARRFNHPQDGMLQYQQITLIPAASRHLKLVVLLPLAASAQPVVASA